MKNIYYLIFLLTTPFFAQLAEKGSPVSWERTDIPVTIEPIVMPQMPSAEELDDNPLNEKNGTALQFGKAIDVDYSVLNSGTWNELPNGDRIWRFRVQSVGAKSLSFVLDEYWMPEGAYLQLYSNDKSDVLGAYDAQSNNSENMLGTWIVKGEDVWLEYFEPASVKNQGKLKIQKIIHGFKDIKGAVENKGINDSGHCNHDVDCPVGNGWDGIKDDLKHSVAFIVQNGFLCSGSLVNNTAEDGTPYFLTANHCSGGGSNPTVWSFRFNWISPNTACGTTSTNTTSLVNHTINGATLLATNSSSDYRLLELNTMPPPSWGLTWSGWDRTGAVPTSTMGIHHPSGDIMKVSRDDHSPSAFNNNGIYWRINGGLQGGWDLGVTESGSSGSPLYNPNGQIIGQLWRGAAACTGTNDNGAFDDYGRFQNSWANGNLGQWLDPLNTGATTLDYITQSQLLNTSEVSRQDVDATIYKDGPKNTHFVQVKDAVKFVEVYAIDGRLVSRIDANGNTLVDLSSSKLVAGKYVVVVFFANGQKISQDFIKQ